MNRKGILVDTNSINDFLRKAFTDPEMKFSGTIIDDIPNISVITQIELLSFNAPPDESLLLEDFVSQANVYELTDNIIAETIRLRKQVRIKVPDVIVAATALINDFVLITRNTDDFKGINGIKLLNIHKEFSTI
jgi:predicted nucleic acid-binding protein